MCLKSIGSTKDFDLEVVECNDPNGSQGWSSFGPDNAIEFLHFLRSHSSKTFIYFWGCCHVQWEKIRDVILVVTIAWSGNIGSLIDIYIIAYI